jgi:carbamoyl-phosphate synthase large subunit
MNIFIESSGSLVSGYMIQAIQEAGFRAVASDITENVFAKHIADDFIVVPSVSYPRFWEKTIELIFEHHVDVVIPSFDETLINWANQKEELSDNGVYVIISNADVIKTFQDKYLTYKFFLKNNVKTPETCLDRKYDFVKPRFGRGGKGIIFNADKNISMSGMISQEYIDGIEYTIDVFCDLNGTPIYIVPRKRLAIVDGKAIAGEVVYNENICREIINICQSTHFVGPINIQCIEKTDGDIFFIEVNPRVGGGMALGFAATENWVKLAVNHFLNGQPIAPKPVNYGMKMYRYYSEIFL